MAALRIKLQAARLLPWLFLIEDNENAISNVAANAVINLSLANAGDSLVLKIRWGCG